MMDHFDAGHCRLHLVYVEKVSTDHLDISRSLMVGQEFLLPLEKLSNTLTLIPRDTRASTKWEPMKPAPPVTRCMVLGECKRT